MVNRKAIPEKMKKRIYQQFQSACPFCEDDNINILEIHHIQPYAKVKKHEDNNLILVCRNCHAKIDNGEISRGEVCQKKSDALAGKLSPKKATKDENKTKCKTELEILFEIQSLEKRLEKEQSLWHVSDIQERLDKLRRELRNYR